MVAIIMPKLASLVTKLQHGYPTLTFTLSDRFYYHVPDTIFYSTSTDASTNQSCLLLLHELGHYLINHNEYQSDVELIKIEALAWAKAKTLAAKYQIPWDDDFIEDQLDTYRDWLHANSLCPNCQLTGFQDDRGLYHCPLCNKTWPSKYHID